MEIKDQVVVVTGGGSGIGRALCERFAADGARAVIVADLHEANAREVAAAIGGQARALNVGIEADVQQLVNEVTAQFGRIDLFCSNAGIIVRADEDAANADWQRHWDVNVMAHVYAARAVLPQMLARGQGYLLNTASAAGLLSGECRAVFGDQTRGGGLRRMAVHRLWRQGPARQLPVPAGRGHADAA